jgi:hypothetical protein
MIYSDTIFTCAQVTTSPNYIKFKYTNGSLDSVSVTVLDTLKPTLITKSDTIYLSGATPKDSASFLNVNDGSFDNCALDSALLNGKTYASFSCGDTGVNKVFVQLYDVNGNVSNDTVSVVVLDTLSPTYTKTDQTVYLTLSSDTLSRNDFLSISSASCFPPRITFFSDTIIDCDDALTNPNFLVFQVEGHGKDSIMVSVYDTLRPALILTPDTLYLNNPSGMDSISFMDVDKGSVDNCALDSATLNGMNYAVFGCADLGAQKVVVNLYDASGNLSVDSTTVYVIDTVTPVYIKTPYTANLVGDSAVVSRTDILSNATGGCFPPKLTILSDTVFYCKDIATNPNYIRFQFTGSTVDSVEVTVKDTTLPTVQLMSDTLYVNSPGDMDTLRFANIDAGTTDNCGIDSTTINGVQELYYGCSDTGAHKITAHVWDVNGNFSSDSTMVYVLDTNTFNYTKMPQTVYIIAGADTLTRTDLINTQYSGCFNPSITLLSDTVFDCDEALTNPNYVRFQFTGYPIDSVAVTVLDTVKPVLLLQTDTLYLNNPSGMDSISFMDVDNGSVYN